MTLSATYDPQLSRVRVTGTVGDGTQTGDTVVDRSRDGIKWQRVRARNVDPANVRVDDYEFEPSEPNTYRVRILDATGAALATEMATITPTLDRVWLKSLSRPFLNRPVNALDFGEVERPARGGAFNVVGRSLPVAVTDVRGSRRYELIVYTETPAEADDLDTVLASGDPVLIHVPPDCPVPRSMYAVIGDVSIARRSVYGPRRYFTLPLTEVAAPAPELVGDTITYQGVLNAFATYADLLGGNATYLDVVERIGDPSEVIVP